MPLFSCGRQSGLCSVRLAALLSHLLDLLAEVLPFQLRKFVSVEVPCHVDAEVACRDLFQLNKLFHIFAKQAIPVAKFMMAPERLIKSTDPSNGT